MVDEFGRLDHGHARQLLGDLFGAGRRARKRGVPHHVHRYMGEPLAQQLCLLASRIGECPERVRGALSGEVEVSSGHGLSRWSRRRVFHARSPSNAHRSSEGAGRHAPEVHGEPQCRVPARSTRLVRATRFRSTYRRRETDGVISLNGRSLTGSVSEK